MGIGQALAGLPAAAWLRGAPWAYPAVETAHIMAIGLLFGSIVVADLRILGVSRALPVAALLRHVLPITLLAFALAAASGLMLFLAHADELIGNRTFVAKMCLIGFAGMNAAIFHTGSWGTPAKWDAARPAPPVARAFAALSLLLWLAVITCGRWIAYA